MSIPRDTPIGTKIICVHDEPFDNSCGRKDESRPQKGKIYTVSGWSFGTDKFKQVCYGVKVVELDCSTGIFSRIRFDLLVEAKIEQKQTERA